MAVYGKKLLDMSGNVILPKTRSSLVYMDETNDTVQETIEDILTKVPGNLNFMPASPSPDLLDNLSPGVYTITLQTDKAEALGIGDGTRGFYGVLTQGNYALINASEKFIRQVIITYDGVIASRSKTGSNAWSVWTVEPLMTRKGGVFSTNASTGPILTLDSTGNESSITYKRSSDGNDGWTLGEGVGGTNKKFCLHSHHNAMNLFEVDPSSKTIHVADTNNTAWCIRNAIITASSWSPVSSNKLWFIRG